MLKVCSRTHPGSVRAINEDFALWDPDLGLIVVADGMGGHNAGEVASRLAVDTLQTFLKQSAAADKITWPFGVDRRLSFEANRLSTAVKVANSRVRRAADERADYAGMGTTLVAAVVAGSRATYTGVGDSRIYAWRGDELQQLTADDSWIGMLQELAMKQSSWALSCSCAARSGSPSAIVTAGRSVTCSNRPPPEASSTSVPLASSS